MDKIIKHVKRLRISEDTEIFYRTYYSGISFQKFIDLCIDNQKRRVTKKRLITPF